MEHGIDGVIDLDRFVLLDLAGNAGEWVHTDLLSSTTHKKEGESERQGSEMRSNRNCVKGTAQSSPLVPGLPSCSTFTFSC